MFQLIYVSASDDTFGAEQLLTVLPRWRETNSSLLVSGMLFNYNNSNMQLLEGPEANVLGLTKTIGDDQRHTDFKILSSHPVEQKLFGDLAMGFIEASKVGNLVEEYTGYDIEFPLLTLDEKKAMGMLKFLRSLV